jgi:two-component system, chemotaxis family, chemotaxis protein CheY
VESGATVLVVDDEDSIREFVSLALCDEGYNVETAPNGAVALELAERLQPDLILLDLRMPVMDGWQFLAAYRETPQPHSRVVVLTAARESANGAEDIEADAFLAKPFDLEQLFDLVQSLPPPSG